MFKNIMLVAGFLAFLVAGDSDMADTRIEQLSDHENPKVHSKMRSNVMTINDYIPTLREIIEETEESTSPYATFWADFPNHVFYVQFSEITERTQEAEKRIRESFPYPDMLKFEFIEFSTEELEEKRKEISPYVGNGNFSNEFSIHSLGISVEYNLVRVGIYPYDEKFVQEIKRKFGADKVMVIERESLMQQPL